MPQVFESTDGVYDKERKLGGLKLITGQFWALLVKRFHHARRNRKGYISQVQKKSKKQTNKQNNVRNFHISECLWNLRKPP